MSMSKKTILTSLLTIAICLTLIAGSTYALFTSEDEINIAVTSGKVAVTATILEDGMKTYSLEQEQAQGVFANGGYADFVTENNQKVLVLDRMTPGDKVEFQIQLTNDSNVAIKYLLVWDVVEDSTNEKDGLYKFLKTSATTVAEEKAELHNANVSWTSWPIPTAEDKSDTKRTINVSIELPSTVGNEAQDLSAKISFKVLAYQSNAPMIASVAELNQKMTETNENLMLIGVNEPQSVIRVPASYTGIITLQDCKVASIQADKDLNLVVNENVTVKAFDSSAITAEGTINIAGSGKLTAIAADVVGGFGIGGMNTDEINIKDVTIAKVSGAFVQKDFINDTKYGKSEPEGGAAIGSGFDGAVINLNNVTINEALGGSKAAGIGARYHIGVTINITDCTINKVVGGNASAGIGGSRVSGDATESGTIINIQNSTINAEGGQAGAGIGSGYDTHCQPDQPLCTININNSTINATGGKYAAGVGTGYHNAALAGEIKNSTVNAVSGEKFYKATYTEAQDIGFGVVDLTREGKDNDSKITYLNSVITLPTLVTNTISFEDFSSLLASQEGGSIFLSESVVIANPESSRFTEFTLNGNIDIYASASAQITFSETTTLVGNGTLTIHGGSIVEAQELCVAGNATLIINNGEHTFNALSATGNGTIIVNGGTLNCKGTYAGIMGITFGENGSLIVNAGKLNLYQPINLNPNRCDNAYVEINGGTIELLGGMADMIVVRNVMDKDLESGVLRGSSVRITGGTFIAHYAIDSDRDATAFIRNGDGPADGNKVLVSNADQYDCIVTGGTFYGSWQRADNTRYTNGNGGYSDGLFVENTIAGFVADGYEITGDADNGYVVNKK